MLDAEYSNLVPGRKSVAICPIHNWAHSMGPYRSPLSRVVIVVVGVVDIDAQAACDSTVATPGDCHEAARCGEWAQHFSNASCYQVAVWS